jgi:hypothetical protein
VPCCTKRDGRSVHPDSGQGLTQGVDEPRTEVTWRFEDVTGDGFASKSQTSGTWADRFDRHEGRVVVAA